MGDENKEGAEGTKKSEVDAAALAEEIKTLRAELATERQEAQKAKGYVARLLELVQQGDLGDKGDDKDDKQDPVERFKEEFEKDPRQAIDSHVKERLRPLLEQQYSQAVVREYEAAKTKNPKLFEKYGEEIVKFMEPMALETQATPGAWEKAAQFVRMQHVDDEIKERVSEEVSRVKENFQNTGLVELPSSDNGVTGSGPPALSSIEREIAKEFGMDPTEWKKYSDPKGETGSVDVGE